MLHVTLNINLSVEGPIMSKSSAVGAYGVDSPMAVDSRGLFHIPGTLVKGHLRQAWEELNEAAGSLFNPDVTQFLGDKSSQGIYDEPSRGLLKFSDFVYEGADTGGNLYRISIDETRKSVRSGAYQVIEAHFKAGSCVCFRGCVSFFVKDEATAESIQRYVEYGLKWITNLGADRTSGFGMFTGVSVSRHNERVSPVLQTANTVGESFGISIRPHNPFCIARRKVSPLLFESETIIPGAVIKGCVAAMWGELIGKGTSLKIGEGVDQERQELSRHFEKIRFTHAFPAPLAQQARPVVPPLSLVKTKGEGYYDVARCNSPVLIEKKSPAFDIDWKERADVDGNFGWTYVPTELRVRTAMSRETRKPKEEHLFAYEMVVPDNFQWLGSIDLTGITDHAEREKAGAQLRALLSQGLHGLGKTKTTATVTVYPQGEPVRHVETETSLTESDLFIVTLQTPALLCNPSQLSELSGRDELCKEYRAVWKELSGESLWLERYFARQSLAGGEYLYNRFMKKNGRVYRPYLLTDKGSVFVLRVENGKVSDAKKNIADWLRKGLPLPEWAKKGYGNHWTKCPYLPENGYGEIVVNLNVHWRKHPVKEVCDDV
jgi:hypothetical protein